MITSKNEINRYQVQVTDLLTLFENYVADTTAYISPLARQTMMRVDRNDIWGNLQQISTGLNNGVLNALITSSKQPNSFLFGLLEDPTDAQKEASAHNKIQLENIQDNIKSTQSVLEDKLEDLNGFYDKKVKPFENTDDDYKGLASNVKKKYTSFFEGIKEVLDTIDQIALDIVKGFVNGLIGMVTGLVTIALDVGIVAVSGLIHDSIEPAFLKKKADETFDGYKDAAIQLIQDPISVVELVAQSVSDTVEQEGIAYVTGEVLTAFVPAAGAVKLVKGASKLKGPAKTKVSNSSYSKEFIQGKIDTAKAGLADVKVPSFTRERLSTGISDIPTVRVEWKKLSETHPQMFAVKGNGKADKSTKGTGNITKEVKEIDFGKHIIRGENGKKQLLPNKKYVTNDHYKYTTDELGRIVNVEASDLVLKKADRNKYAQKNIGGKDRLPDDDGGHLIGAQFNGPGDIDNLVPQNSQINRRGGVWYDMETEWANALKEVPPKKVSVNIEPIYSNNSIRPDSFMLEYEIEGKLPVIREIANKPGG